jgi:hypothetical protein
LRGAGKNLHARLRLEARAPRDRAERAGKFRGLETFCGRFSNDWTILEETELFPLNKPVPIPIFCGLFVPAASGRIGVTHFAETE